MEKGNRNSEIEEIKLRALKITEALYRTTDIMFDGEPLKWSLRNTALEILNIVSSLNSGGQSRDIDRVNNLVQSLFLKLELASSGTFISKMNFEVLEREYSILSNHVVEQSKEQILLDLPTGRQAPPDYRTTKEISDTVTDKSISDKTEITLEVKEEKKIELDSDRKSVIVSALQGNGHSSVSDIAKLFNGIIGEKTVQRELNALVEVGAIKKEGEKRWRRYFL